jgi:magnesium-transporting ATPase (P-type)
MTTSWQRFLQFQMAVNVCALILSMAGAITRFGMPLKPIQLLWVNLIMDTLAGLALATELPAQDMLRRTRYERNDHPITGYMWSNLLVQAFYQVVFLLVDTLCQVVSCCTTATRRLLFSDE